MVLGVGGVGLMSGAGAGGGLMSGARGRGGSDEWSQVFFFLLSGPRRVGGVL